MAKYEEICDLLREEDFEEDVIDVFRKNRIDSSTFLELTREDFLELGVTALGDRKKLLKMKDKMLCCVISVSS